MAHRRISTFIVATALFALVACPTALAQREHRVRSGQSLARIAHRYHVSVSNLAAANGLTRETQLRPGQTLRIPEQGVHYVASGDSLNSIAHDHECSVADLTRVNHLRAGRPLRIGQRLILPGFEASQDRERAAARWGRPRHPGVVTLYRRSIDRRFRVRLVDRRGRARRVARRRLRELMRQRRQRGGRLGPTPPSRLVETLARISDHFGGRTVTIVSGYRTAGGYTRESSQHTHGHALDIRIHGVPMTALRDYVRSTFHHVGVGFYPRSHFVHVDVRDRDAYWVDWSRPGQRPQYQRRGETAPDDATRDEVERTGMGDGSSSGESGEGADIEDDDPNADPDQARLEDESDAPEDD